MCADFSFRMSTTSTVHLLLGCSSRKREHPATAMQLRNVQEAFHERISIWIERLNAAPREIPANQLYRSDAWHVGWRFKQSLSNKGAKLWALSAGYGIVSGDAHLASYSATFSEGHADSVHRLGDILPPAEARRKWWCKLSQWSGPDGEKWLRSVTSIAADNPSSTLVVCVGSKYLEAIDYDLRDAQRKLVHPGRLIVVTSKPCSTVELEGSWVQVPSNLRLVVGGTLASLSVRTATRIMKELGVTEVTAAKANELLEDLSASVSELPIFKRKKVDDNAVVEWIRIRLAEDPMLSKTSALRNFRSMGFACEQSRFSRLFEQAQDIILTRHLDPKSPS